MNKMYLARPRTMCYALIDLKDCHLFIRDGLTGTAQIKGMSFMIGNTTIHVDTVDSNTDANEGGTADQIPVGARFTIAADDTVYTVLTASDSMGDWTLGISPALVAAPADNAAVVILPQLIEIKVGEGNVTFTEKKARDYKLDRGRLSSVRNGDEAPVEVKLDFSYEFIRASSGEAVTAVEAVKGIDGANTFITSGADHCEPYAVDIVVEHNVPCGDTDDEITWLKEFRFEQLDYDLKAATISVSGKCKITDAENYRGTFDEWEASLNA